MATVIFVHGTSVRRSSYEPALAAIRKGLNRALREAGKSEATVAECLWGDSRGVRLNAQGRSIPDYEATGGAPPPAIADPELLWQMLAYDPLFELQGLALRPQKAYLLFEPEDFKDELAKVPSAGLAEKLEAAGLAAEAFKEARDKIKDHEVLDAALNSSDGIGDCALPVARALVAEAAARASGGLRPPAVADPDLRNELVQAVADNLNLAEMGMLDWTKNALFGMARGIHGLGLGASAWYLATGGTPAVRRDRGKLTDEKAPLAGDVLLYQARGDQIREHIRDQVERVEPPVLLLGHSLGGIACVDLLILESLPKVDLLVTVGSQAPFLYEMNALPSLPYGKPLPPTFTRRWVNIYDLNDFLSYQVADVFPLNGEREVEVVDHRVDNKLRFPDAHSGYWANHETWKIIASELRET